MGRPAITVENLGKKYRIGLADQRKRTFGEALVHGLASPFRRLRQLGSRPNGEDIFWALRDVSFEVQPGEVVGIIGRNGAGKSTLLKILSRITEPTEGRAVIRGRVGSLLEVGTGFHPELTGRENVYLNGAILGMRKTEIARQFDEIVAFAEIDKFLDTPVKRYSSGMYVRLAFAVAAHLDPEILIVDEVLAVGDAQFQKKCLGKMKDIAGGGRTVLFVSHNMPAIQRLCPRVLLLDQGCLVQSGPAEDCLRTYLSEGTVRGDPVVDLSDPAMPGRRGDGKIRFTRVELLDDQNVPTAEFRFGQPFRVRLTLESRIAATGLLLGFSFLSFDGVEIQGTACHDGGVAADVAPGTTVLECRISPMILTPGRYILCGAVSAQGNVHDHVYRMTVFDVLHVTHDASATPSGHYVGHVYLPYPWTRVGPANGSRDG